MITITSREELLPENALTARFVGADHGADVSIFWVDAPPGTGPDFHWHPYTETWFVLDGEAQIETKDERIVAKPGNIVTVPPDTTHRFHSSGAGNLHMICVHASPTIIQEFVD